MSYVAYSRLQAARRNNTCPGCGSGMEHHCSRLTLLNNLPDKLGTQGLRFYHYQCINCGKQWGVFNENLEQLPETDFSHVNLFRSSQIHREHTPFAYRNQQGRLVFWFKSHKFVS